MKMKLKALAAVTALFASQAFAAGGDDFTSAIVDITAVDAATVQTDITSALADVYSGDTGVFAQNVVMISQTGNGNFALAGQDAGAGNYIGISQDATTQPGVAVVAQSGATNRAFVAQK